MAYALLEEVAGLLALIESTPELPFAHLAPHIALLATRELETAIVHEEPVNQKTKFQLNILRTIAKTTSLMTFDAAIQSGSAELVWLKQENP